MMSVQCEALEAKSVAGEDINLDTYGALSDRIGRAFHRLGLKRVARDVGPQSIAEYAELKRRRESAA